MIHDRVNMVVVSLSSPTYHEKKINFWLNSAYTMDYGPVRKGEIISFEIIRPEFGDWD